MVRMGWFVVVGLVACKGGGSDVEQPGTTGEGSSTFLGFDDSATVDVMGASADGLNTPRDLAFNPAVPGELWVVNRADDSVSIFHDAGGAGQTSENRIDPYALHFMEEVSSLSFGAATWDGSSSPTWGSCQESRNTYNDAGAPNDFMGPSLWSADLDVFAYTNPDAVEYLTDLFGFPTDLGSHLDMLHESPMCMGIAWETENVYWVFDGRNEQIVRYDFQEDHDVGFDDHSDGLIWRVTGLDVDRVPDIPSHMVVDPATATLYAVDTGNNRVLAIDTQTGEPGKTLPALERGTDHRELDGVEWSVLIDGDAVGMERPSGLALVDGKLVVGDHETGILYAFDLDGELLGTLETGRQESLMGIEAVSAAELWIVDAVANEVLRFTP